MLWSKMMGPIAYIPNNLDFVDLEQRQSVSLITNRFIWIQYGREGRVESVIIARF